jgi:tetratricopeptide (TPR) repeat protein
MKTFLISILSAGLFLIGISYLYYPELVIKANNWLKQNLFDEKKITSDRKKFGVLYILFSFIIISFGVIMPRIINSSNERIIKHELSLSWYYYYKGKYADAERSSAKALERDINNITALEQMCLINYAKGDRDKAMYYCSLVLHKGTRNERLKKIYEELARAKKR